MTKWDMTKTLGRILNQPITHVTPQSGKPEIKPGQTERPWNTKLTVKVLEELGVRTDDEKSFEQWWTAYLAEKPNGF